MNSCSIEQRKSLEEIIQTTESKSKKFSNVQKDLSTNKTFLILKKKIFARTEFFIPLNSFKKSKNQNLLLSIYYPSNFEVDILLLFKVITIKKSKHYYLLSNLKKN